MANVNYIEHKVISPVMTAYFFKVNTVYDELEGNRRYVAQGYFENKADEDAMKAKLDKYIADAKALPENKGKKWRSADDPRIGYVFNEKLGKTLFTFRTNAFRKTDDGETQTYVAVFDTYGRPYPRTTAIGNGSKVQVRFDPAWYYKSKDGNGLSMFLTGICVRELMEFGDNSGDGFEFEKLHASPDIDDPFPED
jgi:hypothetical protein